MKSSRVSALIFIGFILSNNIFSESASANSGSKYKSAQFIGFSLNTGPSSSEAQCRALGKEKPCYVGLKNNIEDVEGRAEIMKKAVELAYKNAEKSSRTLKVFIAPEFYWRGTGGAYPVSSIFDGARPGEKNTINQIGRELESIVSDKRFNDWLFVFGTVIAVNDLVPDDVLENVPGKQRLFYNFSPMYKGGVVRFGKNFIIPKRYISHIDFLKDPVNTDEFTYLSDGTKQYDTELWSQLKEWLSTEKDYKIIENNWFRINNLQYSIEVCLDHARQQALKSAWEGYTRRGAQISLVTSAGMAPTPSSFVLSNNGNLFLQDGLNFANTSLVRLFNGPGYLNLDRIDIIPANEFSTARCSLSPCFGQEFSLYETVDEFNGSLFPYLFPDTNLPAVRVWNPVRLQRAQRF